MDQAKLRDQRGAGTIGCLFIVALVGAAMYAGFMLGLPKLRHRSFEDRVNESLYNLRQMSEEDMRKELVKIAEEFDIALQPGRLEIQKTPAKFTIHATYDKPVDLQVWQTTLHFTLDRSAPM